MTNDLQHSPAQIVSRLLVTLGVATELGGLWPVYYSAEPDRPDATVTVYDTQGTNEGDTQEGEAQGHYGLQVRVRATTSAIAWTRTNLINRALQAQYNTTVTLDTQTYLVQCFARFGSGVPLGRVGGSSRVAFTLNLLVMIHNATTSGGTVPTGTLQDPDGNYLQDPDGNYLQEAA